MSVNIRHSVNKRPFFSLPSQPVFDYTALMDALKEYKRPRDKVTGLLRDEIILRVKKGLYIQNREKLRGIPVKELLANLIYGPSYISLQFALSSYGMIPEEAIQVSSVTFKKTKQYRTPAGDFLYRSVPYRYYLPGINLTTTEKGYSYLIAGPEKALIDMLYFTPGIHSKKDVRIFLLEDMRVDEDALADLDFSLVNEITSAAGTPKLSLCREALEDLIK